MRLIIAEAAVRPVVAVLAAGRGSRFGGGKLDAPLAGARVGDWALRAVKEAGLRPGLLVTGPDRPAFMSDHGEWRCAINEHPERGLGTSLATAARAVTEHWGQRPMLLLLADMPLVDPEFLRRMVASAAPAATRYPSGQPGVPALFAPDMLSALMALSGDRGAAAILASHPKLSLIDPPEFMLTDVDRPVDLERAEALLRRK